MSRRRSDAATAIMKVKSARPPRSSQDHLRFSGGVVTSATRHTATKARTIQNHDQSG